MEFYWASLGFTEHFLSNCIFSHANFLGFYWDFLGVSTATTLPLIDLLCSFFISSGPLRSVEWQWLRPFWFDPNKKKKKKKEKKEYWMKKKKRSPTTGAGGVDPANRNNRRDCRDQSATWWRGRHGRPCVWQLRRNLLAHFLFPIFSVPFFGLFLFVFSFDFFFGLHRVSPPATEWTNFVFVSNVLIFFNIKKLVLFF